MSTTTEHDIFEHWKTNRFIVVPKNLLTNSDEKLVVLTDIYFWNNNFEALKDWCDDNNCEQSGMTVLAHSAQALTMFCLRWS